MSIKAISNPWRDRYQPAGFRSVQFFVETDARQGGRRVVPHEYPKRNTPYSEDMGRKANRFLVAGYLIGPRYWEQKNLLIEALEKDGPGWLRLPLPYKMQDVQVVVMGYTVTEARERGGYCQVEMDFIEYGDPQYRQQISSTSQIDNSALNVEKQVIPPLPTQPAFALPIMQRQALYAGLHNMAMAGVPITGIPITGVLRAGVAISATGGIAVTARVGASITVRGASVGASTSFRAGVSIR